MVTDRPEALAVVAPDATLTYGELWNQAQAFAGQLRADGLQRGDPVALCLPRSAELVISALGILAAGGCYVAIDPAQPVERLRFLVTDCGTQRIVAQTEPAWCPAGVRLVRPSSAGAVPSPATPTASAEPDELAYVVYTSGSTGEPKGVLVEHAGLLNLVRWHQRAFSISPDDRCPLLASPGFDASIWELWPCLTAGASLHVPAEELKTDPGELRDWLIAQGITVAFLPTPLAAAVVELEWPPNAALRFLLTGGDRLHRRPRPDLPFTLVNNYGVAEGTVVSTSGAVSPSELHDDDAPSIGAAIDGVELAVLGADGQPVAPGQPGELVISGPSVARGYLGRPEQEQARFAEGPPGLGVRTYRTGDLVRVGADGQYTYLGRLDDQVQIRGFRVEPGEIISVLDQHPAVGSSAIVVSGPDDAPVLSAYVVGAAAAPPVEEELRAHLSAVLPEHMVPRTFTTVPALPITVNGKVDRQALLSLPRREHATSTAPRNDTERTIAAIVAERLGLPAVGVEENFFLLGGHSMLGAQLIIRISEQFGVELSLRTLFEHPTVAEMSEEVTRMLTEEIDQMSDEELLAAARLIDSPES